MAKQATGEHWRRGKDGIATIRVRLHGARHTIKMPNATSDDAADTRSKIVAELAYRMTLAKSDPVVGLVTLAKIGAAELGLTLKAALVMAAKTIGGWDGTLAGATTSKCPTFDQVAELWNTNALAAQWPDDVPLRDPTSSIPQARRYIVANVPAHIRSKPVDQHTEEDAAEVKRVAAKIPRANSRAKAMQPYKTVMRLCTLAIWPGHPDNRLIKRSPVPEGWLPQKQDTRELQWIRPHEDTQLAACTLIPVCWRVLWACFTRNGAREEELMAIAIDQFDLGAQPTATLYAHQTKTRKRRFWSLGDCVMIDPNKRGTECAEGLRRWVATGRAGAAPTDHMFVDEQGQPVRDQFAPPPHVRAYLKSIGIAKPPKHITLPGLLRVHLRMAGITRRELFSTTASARNIVVHDLRATNATVRLAMGWTPKQIMRCTGHETEAQLKVYEREAETLADIQAGNFVPLHLAIPELAAAAPSAHHASAPPVVLHLVAPAPATPAPPAAAWPANHPLPTAPAIPRETGAASNSIVEANPTPEPAETTAPPAAGMPGPASSHPGGQSLAALEARVEALQALLLGGFAAEVSGAVLAQLQAAGVLAPPAPAAASAARRRRR